MTILLSETWTCGVSARNGWPGELARLICNFCLSDATTGIVLAGSFLRFSSYVAGTFSGQGSSSNKATATATTTNPNHQQPQKDKQ